MKQGKLKILEYTNNDGKYRIKEQYKYFSEKLILQFDVNY